MEAGQRVDVRNGYPGAKVGYCTVASVLLDLLKVEQLDASRPINPTDFRKTEEASTLDAAMPGCNVVTRDHTSAIDSFREALYENFHDATINSEDGRLLLNTYQELKEMRPSEPITCPYLAQFGCERHVSVGLGVGSCGCEYRRPIYSTDALRIHERCLRQHNKWRGIRRNHTSMGTRALDSSASLVRAGEMFCMSSKIAFLMDGPLAVMFGHPAWLSPRIKAELKRLNKIVRGRTNDDLLIIGVEKTGAFVSHLRRLIKPHLESLISPIVLTRC